MIRGLCGWSCVRRELRFDVNRNCVDCEMFEILKWILLELFLRSVTNVLLVNPYPLEMGK